MLTNTKNSPYAKVSPLSWNSVSWTDGFWADVVESNTKNTVPHLQKMFESKEISHVLENFKICAGESTGSFDGTVFGDGDFYKWMESALYSAGKTADQQLLDQLDNYIGLIGRAQRSDGYISTKQIIGEMEHNGVSRLGDINDFEVYNFGHLFTAACLHKRVTDKDHFLSIAIKAAEYLEHLYEESAKTDEVQTAVCPSHYMGLIELYRTVKNEKYLKLAILAISLRDSVKDGLDDNQDRLALKDHDKIIGHAVRANYLYAGVADLYLETGKEEYLQVLHKVWNNLIHEKIYITGGCGALYNGASPYGNFFVHQLVHQAYGYEYQLPNVTAYNETCASIGSVMWAYRMFQLDPKAEYFDLIERTMLNVNLAAVSLDGTKYFYENMLRRAKKLPYELVWPLTRSEYILSYCCPPNLARILSQSSEYAYTVSPNNLWIGMYGANKATISLPNSSTKTGEKSLSHEITFELTQETHYPYDGKIRFTIDHVKGGEFQLQLRIPGWVEKGKITSPNSVVEVTSDHASSYLPVTITENCIIEVDFDMTAHYTISHPLVEENNNQVAVERGPLVYCMESPDSSLDTLDDLLMDPDATFTPVTLNIKGRTVIALKSQAYYMTRDENHNPNALYQPLRYQGLQKTEIQMIPYFAWDNRGIGEMRIWMPVLYKI
ncbi:MAG TPA: glycoside hydrolase family 127 protein [Candidatus Merdenecus merdavium]|nr:glycoside hydrolase family 127 protein [Candidatus Merdenecus merdavium]